MIRWYSCALISFLLLLLSTGCGGTKDQLPTTKVDGSVSYQGKTLESGTVTFFPVSGGKHAVGMISNGGTFTLSTFATGDGAIIGKHKVVINVSYEMPDGNPVPDSVPRIPKKYSSRETTPLIVDVTQDGGSMPLNLK